MGNLRKRKREMQNLSKRITRGEKTGGIDFWGYRQR